MNTAFESIAREKIDQERDERRIDYVIKEILERWAPEDPIERHDFDRQLIYLVQLSWREAQKPLLNTLTQLAAAIPFIPPTFKEPK